MHTLTYFLMTQRSDISYEELAPPNDSINYRSAADAQHTNAITSATYSGPSATTLHDDVPAIVPDGESSREFHDSSSEGVVNHEHVSGVRA